jgi:hypothetical protein
MGVSGLTEDTPPVPDGRSRRWLADALVGGAVAVGLITAANAALPRIERTAEPRARLTSLPAAPARSRPQPPAALIAFEDPVPGYPVISPFGLRKLPWEEGGRLHAGVDIAAPAGLPVRAAADGVVVKVATDGGYGRVVEVKHAAGLLTVYAHLGRFLPEVREGAAVKAGAPVGLVGSTGSSTGAHVHFEVRNEQNRPLNPDLFLGRRFAAADDLPLRTAARIPRGVRVAYVSTIPRSKREEMQAKLEEKVAAEAATAAMNATAVEAVGGGGKALSATDAAADANASLPEVRMVNGRPQARFKMHE